MAAAAGAAILIVLLFADSAEARDLHKPQKARVHFLAVGTLIRGSWGMNLDSYLAELVKKSDSIRTVVRIVDEYPQNFPPLDRETLTFSPGTGLRIRRDESCDVPYGALRLRAAPGDAMALLQTPMRYEPSFDPIPSQESIVPCYRVVRKW